MIPVHPIAQLVLVARVLLRNVLVVIRQNVHSADLMIETLIHVIAATPAILVAEVVLAIVHAGISMIVHNVEPIPVERILVALVRVQPVTQVIVHNAPAQ
jgi:hypothetical protein